VHCPVHLTLLSPLQFSLNSYQSQVRSFLRTRRWAEMGGDRQTDKQTEH
jgi:hypothetical protein